MELATEHLDAHDGEYEPEHEADQQHVEDGGYRVHQCVDNDLGGKGGVLYQGKREGRGSKGGKGFIYYQRQTIFLS